MNTRTDCDSDADSLEQRSILSEFNNSSASFQHNEDFESYTTPTAEEWKVMKAYGSFITRDAGDVEHAFHLHDMIYVLPTGMRPGDEVNNSDLWIAEIRAIRAQDDKNVWIKAKWFYHPTELPKKVRGVTGKLKRFATLERIISNQGDLIPCSTCCGIADIVRFNERDLEQRDIADDIFFYRYDYDWEKRSLKGGSPPCSICKKIYNPDVDIMHFCPRPRCRRSWHARCLSAANWIITSSVNLPQRFESLDGSSSPGKDSIPKTRGRKVRAEPSQSSLEQRDLYANVPPKLLTIARQPIVRGGTLGVVGNVRSVVRARKMLQEALEGTQDIPEDWEERLGTVFDADVIAARWKESRVKGKGKGVAYKCPNCSQPI